MHLYFQYLYIFHILFSRPVWEFGIALDMLQVVRYILGSDCRAGRIDRGCEKQSASTRDSEVLKRSFQQSTCPSYKPDVITYIVAGQPYSIF